MTGFPELLEGRVKTLHPVIHAAILARRSRPADMAELARRGIAPIDMVVVDLYPFAHAEELGAADDDARAELIDIGGVALIRAAAKNWRDVAVVTDRGDYDAVIAELTDYDPVIAELGACGGGLSGETRRRLAAKAMRLTSAYDAEPGGESCPLDPPRDVDAPRGETRSHATEGPRLARLRSRHRSPTGRRR